MTRLPVLCLAGPTGCGKTALALKIAEFLPCEIINADSRQVYADFPIITAQPLVSERTGIPHHLYGFLESGERLGAGQWARMASKICAEVLSRRHIPLIVGGTGFYFRALLTGLAAMPSIPEEIHTHFQQRLDEEGVEALHAELARADPFYAARIHPHDRQRVHRALEVLAATGKTFSWWHRQGSLNPPCAGPLFTLTPALKDLEPLLKKRIDKMVEAGALEEGKKARRKNPDWNAPAWSGIGCREVLDFLVGKFNQTELKRLWLASTRAYAKRQLTWFRGEPKALKFSEIEAIFKKCRRLWDAGAFNDLTKYPGLP